jgi:ribosomal protein S18 acetylase RimI-like enzyme
MDNRSNKTSTYTIGTLDTDRWREYKALVLAAVENEPEAFYGTKQEIDLISETQWRERLKKEGTHVIFAFHKDAVTGTASLVIDSHEKIRHRAQIISVYVAPAYRRNGIGKKLIQTLIDKAKSYSFIESLVLQVTTTQMAAIALYESFGFKREAILSKVIKIGDAYKEQYIMTKELT